MQKIRIDFDNPGLPQHISAVENDSQSRFFQASLYENGKAYTAPEGATYSIMYRGFGPQNQGWYDTINDGAGKRAACAVSGNVVTCEIARQALQVPGHVSIVLCVTTGKGYMLKSWPIECDCKNDRYDSTVEIQSFFYVTQISNESWTQAIQAVEELKNTIDPTLSLSGKAADAAKVGEAVGQLKENLEDIASSIVFIENLFDYSEIESDVYLNPSNGKTANFGTTGVYITSGFIDLKMAVKICTPCITHCCFYSKKNSSSFISSAKIENTNRSEQVILVPENARYARIDININTAKANKQTDISKTMVVQDMEELPYKFVPYGKKSEIKFSDDKNNFVSSFSMAQNMRLGIDGVYNFDTLCMSSDIIPIQKRHFTIPHKWRVVFFDESKKVVAYSTEPADNKENFAVDAPYYYGYAYYAFTVKQNGSNGFVNPYNVCPYSAENYWRGKRILWLGTSIPEGNTQPVWGYPDELGKRLGATVINMSLGSSSITAGYPTKATNDDPFGLSGGTYNKLRSLTQTTAFKESILNDWAKWQPIFTSAPLTLTETQKQLILTSSYEVKLDPYLRDDNNCDVYVIDMGWNDNTTDLTGKDSDNRPYNTWNYITTADDKAANDIYRYDVMTFRGAYNWIIKRIHEAQPQAQIVLIGMKENVMRHTLLEYQRNIANENSLPLLELWRVTNESPRTITTKRRVSEGGYWYTANFTGTVEQSRIYDGTHPHGWMTDKIADWLTAQFMYNIR